MSRTEPRVETSDEGQRTPTLSVQLSQAFFDDVLAPLASGRLSRGAPPYFPSWREGDGSSFFVPSSVSTMSVSDFEFPGGGTGEGLIDALGAHWSADDEPVLAAATPRLAAIVAALRDEVVDDDGSVDVFCYTLF